VAAGWRPYTEGQWVWTDEFGWTWVSDEPWGWATYHYGRWYFDPIYGWSWVPGRVWAPAWVSWRQSTDHMIWAPLPPEALGDIDEPAGNQVSQTNPSTEPALVAVPRDESEATIA
jgi:hypothetical protein